jgi:hypothetical protein
MLCLAFPPFRLISRLDVLISLAYEKFIYIYIYIYPILRKNYVSIVVLLITNRFELENS